MDGATGVVPRPSYLACFNVPKVGQSKLAGIQKAELRAVPTLAELSSFRRPLVCRVELHGASSTSGAKTECAAVEPLTPRVKLREMHRQLLGSVSKYRQYSTRLY